MDEIREMLAKITELSDEELRRLRNLILAKINATDEKGDAVTASMSLDDLTELSNAAQVVREEVDRRESYEETRMREEATLLASAADLMTVPTDRLPRAGARVAGPTAVTAAGLPVEEGDALAGIVASALQRSAAHGPKDGERQAVATLRWQHPRTIGDATPEATEAVLASAAAEHAEAVAKTLAEQPEAMTAAGGFGVVRQPLYDLPGWEQVDRPLRNSLPGVNITRGGITFAVPPTLAQLDGATSIWTNQNDIDAVTVPTTRKPAIRVAAPAQIVADLQAVVSRVIYGNAQARFAPEWTRRVMELQRMHHSLVAEQQLATQIGALSTAVTGTGPAGLGATRVLLPVLERAAVALRSRGFMAPTAAVQCLLPDWTRSLLRADLTAQEPGDSTLGVTDAELSRYLSVRGLAVTYLGAGAETGQSFGAQASGALVDYPAFVRAYVFAAGTFVFGDGGTLDLGLVRDSVLNGSNDAEVFFETWENVVRRGGESLRLHVPVSANGVSRAAA